MKNDLSSSQNAVKIARVLAALLMLCCAAATPKPEASPLPPKQLAQQRWLKSQLIIVDNRQKRLEKQFGHTDARKTLCAEASSAEVGWAKRYCETWGDSLYLDYDQDKLMFGAAHDALTTALYVINRRALRPQEMDVYSWGMREWKISENTFERMLNTELQNDVHEMKMLDEAEPYCDAHNFDKCFALKDVESKYEKAHRCNFSKFTFYKAFTSVDEYNDKVVKLHTSPAITTVTCSGS